MIEAAICISIGALLDDVVHKLIKKKGRRNWRGVISLAAGCALVTIIVAGVSHFLRLRRF